MSSSCLNTTPELAQPLSTPSIITNSKLLNSRKIFEGRMIEFNSLSEYHVYEQFNAAGWSFLIDQHELIHPRHLKEFYTGFNLNSNTSTITISMYDKTFCWTLENFCDLLHIPCDGPKVFTKSHDLSDLLIVDSRDIVSSICRKFIVKQTTMLSQEDLLPECIIWHKILVHNLFMRGKELSKVLAIEAYVLYCLKNLRPCNLGYIFVKNMNKLPLQLHTPMKYGMLLTRLFDQLAIPRTSFLLPQEPVLNKNQIHAELNHVSKWLKPAFPTPCLPHELVFKPETLHSTSTFTDQPVSRREFELLKSQVEQTKTSVATLFKKLKKGLCHNDTTVSTQQSHCFTSRDSSFGN